MKHIIVALIICCSTFPMPAVAGAGNSAVKLIVTLLTGAAAAAAAKNADAADAAYKEKESIADKLKALGIDPTSRAIYSAYLRLDKNADAIYWERWIGWPNVILEVEIGGQGSFLFPRIDQSYEGQPILENLIGEVAAPGTRVIIHVLDDKQFENQVWNSILQTKINYNISSDFTANDMVKVNVQTDGSLQILNENVVIVQPVCMATAYFIVPNSKDGLWLADATFRDNNNNNVGTLQFAQVWSNPVSAAEVAHSNFIFWIVTTGVVGLVFVKLLFSKQVKS